MSSNGADGPIMDHLALASNRAWNQVIRYCHELGGRWLGGPSEQEGGGFYFCQVEFRGGTKLEFIEPIPGPGSDFVRRFLHRNGPGPHHITFKVTDIEAAMNAAREAGYDIVNENLDDELWKEAFLHPKQSHGIVIQLAQAGPDEEWPEPPPLPPTDQAENTTIDCVTHLVSDLDRATRLFTEVLGMEQIDRHDHPLGERVSLRSGPWTLALVAPSAEPVRHWLGNRAGRLLQVEMSVDHPAAVSDLRPIPGGYELPPDKNLGTRILLKPNH